MPDVSSNADQYAENSSKNRISFYALPWKKGVIDFGHTKVLGQLLKDKNQQNKVQKYV